MHPNQQPSINFGVVAGGDITGNVQNAPGAQNTTLNQTNTPSPQLVEARQRVQELREAVQRHQDQLADPQACLDELAAIDQRLPRAGDDPTTLRAFMNSVYQRCGGIPGLATIAALVQQSVAALM